MIIFLMLLVFALCSTRAAADESWQIGHHPGGALATRLDIYDDIAAPRGVVPVQRNTVECQGDNTNFIGCMGAYFQVRDRAGVSKKSKGVLYGIGVSVVPTVDRNNVPFDDVALFAGVNDGSAKGTEAIYVGRGSRIEGSEWIDVFGSDANADWGIRIAGRIAEAVLTTRYADLVSGRAIELGNGHSISGLDKQASFWTNLVKLNDREEIEIGSPWRSNVLRGFSKFGAEPPVNNGIVSGRQIVNGGDTILAARNTDRAPAGTFLRFVNAANSQNLFQIDIDGSVPIVAGRSTFTGAKTIGAASQCTMVFESGMLVGGTC